jgi:CHAT domain-containing protein
LRTLRFNLSKFTLGDVYLALHQHHLLMLMNHCLNALYHELVKPILSLLETKKLIIIPHGVLHYIPFHALYDGAEYLVDRHEISYGPSAGVFKLCTEKARARRATGPALIVGVPDEATPFINEEVAALKGLWPDAEVLLGEAATRDRLMSRVTESRLLHMASHGVFRRDRPLFSALKLSDSWLSFYDIFHLNLTAELVTLSACETGLNHVLPGDELFGLMRGFLCAGPPSLIVSLWLVNDRSTAALMRRFYEGLTRGFTKRAALRQAQRMVKHEHPHPYYWAPFILMGAAA